MRLYHYEKIQGTTTFVILLTVILALYHYEKIQGTTTVEALGSEVHLLYHYEKIQGTTTKGSIENAKNGYTTTRKYRELQP